MTTGLDELIEAVRKAGGSIEARWLSSSALAALPLASALRRIICESCRLEIVGHYRRRFCDDCGTARENRAQWQREKARARRRP